MSIATLIDKIVIKHRERQQVEGTEFPTIVRQVADGKEPDPEVVERVLFEAGKSFDDLKTAAELLQSRRQWRAQVDAMPKISAEYRRVERQITTANRALEAAEKRHYDEVMPLDIDLARLKGSLSEGEEARKQLWETCSDPDLLGQLNETVARFEHASRAAAELVETVRQWREWAKRERTAAEAAKMMIDGDHDVKQHLARAKDCQRKTTDCETKLAAIQKTIADFQRREEQIRERMLVP
jgi:hypothetical protein